MDVLLEVYKPKDRGEVLVSFKNQWQILERSDKIETLVRLEKEIKAQRNRIIQEMMQMSKGKW